ncbi:type IV secretory system conjugative DNA transfer family protein [Zunongwangia profunda]|uniref:type IV secretory system conjugative DNA transfer family protein n=1 Tax=Zunongwangia profunda TaxID=398743 RepID=UPI001D17E639|nr:type IV secretory system conjugative DNA transfer family protein [Zunongwangia profunda]MCC4226818.1 type IV secretion system DNA-binding domain-containing protein [Zunongwangia profunda]
MQLENLVSVFLITGIAASVFYMLYRISRYAFFFNSILLGLIIYFLSNSNGLTLSILVVGCPLMLINITLYVFLHHSDQEKNTDPKYTVSFAIHSGYLQLDNIKRGASVIGSAGSGKTESVVYGFLKHFRKEGFCGIIHDYKDFELTEMAYPLFKDGEIPFKVVSFDKIIHRVNPIAPHYVSNEESVNEVSRVLLENLLEQKESGTSGTTKFFNDAAEGLIGGLIWKLKTSYPDCCSLPHLIAVYQLLDTDSLIAFLSGNQTSKAMASAFIQGKGSERQTAGVKSTLANALKKITTEKIFYVLSGDEVPLDINNPQNPAVISVVNNPKYDSAYSPLIATIIHTIIKQMSARNREPSFVLMEEAPTIRLLNMHRIPATLRSYDVATIYVMQDKIQNDLMYGEKASKAILSNLSYQFFGKVNDPDTARYYERFFELVKQPTTSVNRSYSLDFDTRVTTGEREVSKIRASRFFGLRPGEFVTYADGKEKQVRLKRDNPHKETGFYAERITETQLKENFQRVFREVYELFQR